MNVNTTVRHADFGKFLKKKFPSIKTKRIGQRGHSKYPLTFMMPDFYKGLVSF
jgi:hypothetical protein